MDHLHGWVTPSSAYMGAVWCAFLCVWGALQCAGLHSVAAVKHRQEQMLQRLRHGSHGVNVAEAAALLCDNHNCVLQGW